MAISESNLIFDIVVGFLGLIFLTAATLMLVFWRRRKLTFTNFLDKTGKWERMSWMPDKIHDEFIYDGEIYRFNIKKCTRDHLNRAIAHYYKGNPEQQLFDISLTNKSVHIGTEPITMKDFVVLMFSKVLRDIFQDEEVMNMLKWIMIVSVGVGLIVAIIVLTHNPPVTLKEDNGTATYFTKVCADACKQVLIKPATVVKAVTK